MLSRRALALICAAFVPQGRRHHGQEGATQAVAQRVDARRLRALFDGRHGLHHAQAQVVLHAQVSVGCVGVAPGNDEHRIALAHQIAHHGIGGREVQDVVLHDARGHDEQRLRINLVGGGCVLDQLDQVVAKHHLARRGGHILAHLKGERLQRLRVGIGRRVPVLLQVFGEVLVARQQTCSAGCARPVVCLGIGGGPVGGRQCIQRLAGEKIHHMLVMARQAIDLRRLAPPGIAGLEAFLQGTERPLLPAFIAKTCILLGQRQALIVCLRARRSQPGLLRQRQGALPQHHLPPGRQGQVHGPVGRRQRHGHRRKPHVGARQLRLHCLVQGPGRLALPLGYCCGGRQWIHMLLSRPWVDN